MALNGKYPFGYRDTLQWGRAQVSAEMIGPWFHPVAEMLASMGPRSGERGNLTQAQTSMRFMWSFNGAALR